MYYSTGGVLYHFGIKGMRWGYRRYQNKDGTLTQEGKIHYGYGHKYEKGYTVKKGTKISRLSFTENETHKGMTYASFKQEDVQKYVSNGKKLVDLFGGEMFQYDFVAKEDLKIPSRYERVNTYLEFLEMQKPKSKVITSGRAKQEESFNKFQYDLVKRKPESKEYYKLLVAKGYNAIFDDADMKSGISEMPIIVLDREKSLKLKSVNHIRYPE